MKKYALTAAALLFLSLSSYAHPSRSASLNPCTHVEKGHFRPLHESDRYIPNAGSERRYGDGAHEARLLRQEARMVYRCAQHRSRENISEAAQER